MAIERQSGGAVPASGKTPALTPEQAERYRAVVQLRTAGITFDAIARQLGYSSRQGAKEAYDAALRRWGTEIADDARQLEELRLDDLWRRTYSRINSLSSDEDTSDEFTKLTQTAVRISARRAGLLGLDAPRQVEVAGPGGGPVKTDIGQLFRDKLRELES